METELYKEGKIQRQTEAMIKTQRNNLKVEIDPEEDDLAGWASQP